MLQGGADWFTIGIVTTHRSRISVIDSSFLDLPRPQTSRLD